MDRIQSINRERIRWCSAERGVTPEQMATDVGISQRAMRNFLEEGVGLTFLQLRKVAEYFGRGVLFFLDAGPVDQERIHTVQYRTLASQKPALSFGVKKLIERVEWQRDLYLQLRQDLHPGDYVSFEAPRIENGNLQDAAATVRAWLGLGNTNTFESYREAVEAKGILVFRSNGYAGRWQIAAESAILGFSLYSEQCPVIFIRKAQWETKQTFTLMHELAHLVLHRESSIDDDEDMQSRVGREREANAFAGRLLVPDAFLDTIRDDERPANVEQYEAWLQPYKTQWGVSVEAILRRLLDANRLTQAQYNAYRTYVYGLPIQEGARGSRVYRHREPKHIFGEPFVRTILDAFAARRITATKACSYLDGIKLTDLHKLEAHVADL